MDAVDAESPARHALARAKINLALHVVGKRADGYHLLDGLVAFADVADRLTIRSAHEDGLRIAGPMAPRLQSEDNILLRALDVARKAGAPVGPVSLTLEKNLPVAAGIGGGSADAAALLRSILEDHPELTSALRGAAARLGADVPMCLDGVPARIVGIGEIVEPLAAMPVLPIVLVNPNQAVSTPTVFRALPHAANAPLPPLPPAGFETAWAVADFLAACRNDLEPPALAIAPVIGEVGTLLRATQASLVRMSGSGATMFALYETNEAAAAAAKALAADRPDWWVAATCTGGTSQLDKRR